MGFFKTGGVHIQSTVIRRQTLYIIAASRYLYAQFIIPVK
jgi:hypothetical protein